MTRSEAKESCEGGSFTSHRGELRNTVRSEEMKVVKNNDVDHLSEQVSSISIDESKYTSDVDNEINEKLGKLSISSIQPIRNVDDDIANEKSYETTEVTDEGKEKSLPLNITEPCDGVKENDKELKDQKKFAEKSTVCEFNVIVDGNGKCEDGNDKEEEDDDSKKDVQLFPRRPMRLLHGQDRSQPYQVPSRNLHHNSGGFCCVAEQSTYFKSNDENERTSNPKIPSEFLGDTSFDCPPRYPFPSAASPAEYTNAELYSSPSLEFCNGNSNDIQKENLDEGLTVDELWVKVNEHLQHLQQHDKNFLNQLEQANSDPESLNTDQSCSPIPVSVKEFDSILPESVTNLGTVYCSPLSVSSGYNSSDSPRSTFSTPSPRSSLKGSQEEINMGFNDQTHAHIGGYGNDAPPSIQASPAPTDFSLIPANHQNNMSSIQPSGYFDSIEFLIDGSEYNSTQLNADVPNVFAVPIPQRLEPNPTFLPVSATERLKKKLDKAIKIKTWAYISTFSDQHLSKGDADGDTPLMILLSRGLSQECSNLELIYAIVERLKKIPNALTAVSKQGYSALYMAALHCAALDAGLITRYIAESLLSVGATLDTGGESLLHCLCRYGGKHFSVLRELLSLNVKNPCFQLDEFNDKGMTALHVAASSHQGSQIDCTKMIRLLINAGAEATLLTEDKARCSALHLAIEGSCDPSLVEALLTSPSVAASCGDAFCYGQDTVLHLAARRNDLYLAQQCRVIKALIARNARRNARDSKGKVPLELVAPERREVIKLVIEQKR